MTGDMRKEAVTRAAASTMKVKAPLMGYVVSYGITWYHMDMWDHTA